MGRIRLGRTARFLATAVSLLGAAAIATSAAATTVSGLRPASPQPATESLAPGLAVEYLNVLVRHVDEVEQAGKGKPGEPLPALDWNSGDGDVLTSGRQDSVGARITGYIRFPDAGTYIMTIQSNDGVRMKISDRVIIEDPGVHSDQFSEYVEVQIAEPGWYPLYMVYFERKGTATLELYWQPPGAGSFALVPPEAFAHAKP